MFLIRELLVSYLGLKCDVDGVWDVVTITNHLTEREVISHYGWESRSSFKLSDPPGSCASELISFFYRCCQTHASTLLETCNMKASWWRRRNCPKRAFISWRNMATVCCHACKLIILSKGGNRSNMLKHISTHGLNVQEYHVSDPMYECFCLQTKQHVRYRRWIFYVMITWAPQRLSRCFSSVFLHCVQTQTIK